MSDLTVVIDKTRHILRDQKCNGSISITHCGITITRAPKERDHGQQAAPCVRCQTLSGGA